MTFLEEIKSLGIEYHTRTCCSDLYVPVNQITKELLIKHKIRAEIFKNEVEGGLWFDIFGGNDEYWKGKQK